MENTKYKIGIVGFGNWGVELYKFFNELNKVKIVAISKRVKNIPGDIKLDGIEVYTDIKKFFSEVKMDAVVIATPPTEHLLPAKLAAKRGIHIFCEKPMAASIDDCDEMIKVCKENNVKLFIAFKHRYAKAYLHIKENLKSFGKPLWAMYAFPLWKFPLCGWEFLEEGCKGIIVENVVHAIDTLRYLMGDIKRIYAEGDNFIFNGVKLPDSVISTFRFTNGAIAGLGGGCTSEEKVSREYMDIHFRNGVAQVWGYLDHPYNLRVFMRDSNMVEEHCFDKSDGVKEEIRHFIECIEENKEPLASGIDGREAVRVALKMIESIRINKIIEL